MDPYQWTIEYDEETWGLGSTEVHGGRGTPKAPSQLSSKSWEMLRGFVGVREERYDYIITWRDFWRYTEEEVILYETELSPTPTVVPLPIREARLQIDFEAEDWRGEKAAVLSREETERACRELFRLAEEELRNRDHVPTPIQQLLADEKWPSRLIERSHAGRAVQGNQKLRLEASFRTILQSADYKVLTPPKAAVLLLWDFIDLDFAGMYRPWLELTPHRRQHFLARYQVNVLDATGLNLKDLAGFGLLGTHKVGGALAMDLSCSTHLRLRPPEGMRLANPIRAGAGELSFMGKAPDLRVDADSEQLQLYISPAGRRSAMGDKSAESSSNSPRLSFSARFDQRASTRALASLLFILAILAPLLVWVFGEDGLEDSTEWGNLGRLILVVGLPLIAVSWESKAARPFAVAQVLLSMLVLGLWALVLITPWLAAVPIAGGGFLASWNIWKGSTMVMKPVLRDSIGQFKTDQS